MPLWTLIAGCGLLEPAPPPEPEPPACGLTLDALVDRTFVREQRNKTQDGDEPDRWARMRFRKVGETTKVLYNSRSPNDMYDYTCTKEKGGLRCMQDIGNDPAKLKQICQTLWANKGSCSVAEVAAFANAPVPLATAAAKEINDAIAKLKPEEKERMKSAFSQPNNQLRGSLKVKVNPERCRLAIVDTYQTMTEGTVRDMETFVGNSTFVELDEPLPFTKCDAAGLAAFDITKTPPEPRREWAPGDNVSFLPLSKGLAKGDAACSYSMDVWSDFAPTVKGQAVTAGADGALDWRWSGPFAEPGKHMVQMIRHKACAGAEAQVADDICTLIQVQ
jgi:hypothetical protein